MLRLADNISHEVVETALRLSIQKFGRKLAINGTDSFRKQAIEVAASAKLNIAFTDPAMEEQRKLQLATKIALSISKEDAAGRYIDERNQKRDRGMDDILPHRRFTEGGR